MRRHLAITIAISVLLLASLACNVNFDAQEASPEDIQSRPLVRLLAPANNSVYAEGAEVQFYAIAQDSLAGVSRIEFRLDDTLKLGEVNAPNPEPSFAGRMVWTAEGKQAHQLIVEAFRADGSSLGESAVLITVVAQPSASVVEGAPLTAPQTTPPVQTATPGETVAPTATPVPTPTQRPADIGIISGPTARVMVAELYARQGPGTTYAPVGVLLLDDILKIVGRNEDSTWWAIDYGEGIAWVLASQVSTQGDVANLPLVAPP
jgi:hypothetical protein